MKTLIHQIDRKWMVAPFSKFYCKIWDGFSLTQDKVFSERFYFNVNKKSIGSSKTICFYVIFNENFRVFTTLALKQMTEKRKPFSKNWSTATGILKPKYSYTKLPCQRPMLREIIILFNLYLFSEKKWNLQNLITFMIYKNYVSIFNWKTKNKKCKSVFSEQIRGRNHMIHVLICWYRHTNYICKLVRTTGYIFSEFNEVSFCFHMFLEWIRNMST